MYRLIFLLLTHTLTNARVIKTSAPCERIIANFDLKTVSGKWHMVAVIPSTLYPDEDVKCFKSGVVEADKAKSQAQFNKTLDDSSKIKGTIVRHRFYTERLFDIWAQDTKGFNVCLEKSISVDTSNPDYIHANDVYKMRTNDDMTQLHLLDAADGIDPFLIHIFWERPLSAIVYRKTQAVTQEQLKPVVEFLCKLRGPQRLPKLCQNTFENSQALNLGD